MGENVLKVCYHFVATPSQLGSTGGTVHVSFITVLYVSVADKMIQNLITLKPFIHSKNCRIVSVNILLKDYNYYEFALCM